jgi:hypothetical protein
MLNVDHPPKSPTDGEQLVNFLAGGERLLQ